MIRLNKYLSMCGLGSRRKVEELILSGKITLNGKEVKNLAVSINPESDIVTCDSLTVSPRKLNYYLILNKPRGYVTTLHDEKGRPIVMDLIPNKYIKAGVFPVGRLDKDTEGLLFLTNDGDLAQKLNRPENKFVKGYHVELDKPLREDDKKKIEKGLFIHQIKTKTRPATIQYIGTTGKSVLIYLHEGKKRQIRYSFKNLQYNVKYLKRISYGPLQLAGVNKGEYRLLKSHEIRQIKSALNLT